MIVNAGVVNANLRILRRRISANLLPIQVEFCVCRIPLNIFAIRKLTARAARRSNHTQKYINDFNGPHSGAVYPSARSYRLRSFLSETVRQRAPIRLTRPALRRFGNAPPRASGGTMG